MKHHSEINNILIILRLERKESSKSLRNAISLFHEEKKRGQSFMKLTMTSF